MVWRPDCEVSVELANESMRLSVMLLHLELVQPPAKADEPGGIVKFCGSPVRA